jgi:hypothetical protein
MLSISSSVFAQDKYYDAAVDSEIYFKVQRNGVQNTEALGAILSNEIYARFSNDEAPFRTCGLRSRHQEFLNQYNDAKKKTVIGPNDLEPATDKEDLSIAICVSIDPQIFPNREIVIDFIDNKNSKNSFSKTFSTNQAKDKAIQLKFGYGPTPDLNVGEISFKESSLW